MAKGEAGAPFGLVDAKGEAGAPFGLVDAAGVVGGVLLCEEAPFGE